MNLEETLANVALLLTMFVSAVVSAQQTPTTGYAPVPGKGDPVVLLHGSFMRITNNWILSGERDWIGELSKTRQVRTRQRDREPRPQRLLLGL
jgi:hypothetical protein